MTQKKISNLSINLMTAISFPFITVFLTFTLLPFLLLLLMSYKGSLRDEVKQKIHFI